MAKMVNSEENQNTEEVICINPTKDRFGKTVRYALPGCVKCRFTCKYRPISIKEYSHAQIKEELKESLLHTLNHFLSLISKLGDTVIPSMKDLVQDLNLDKTFDWENLDLAIQTLANYERGIRSDLLENF